MIFSGDNSEQLWKHINRLSKKGSYKKRKKFARRVMFTIYLLGCKCQELESKVERLKRGRLPN